jgi:hypothetical protein
MANHPITLISPTQVIQSAAAFNNDQFSPSNSSTPPTAGQGETSTGVSGGTEASVTVAPGTIAPDAYALQSNDTTAFVFGSTASNQAAASNQYTTVDDTSKSVNQAAIRQDQTIRDIFQDQFIRERKKKRRSSSKKKEIEEESSTTHEEEENEIASLRPYSADAKRTLARAMEKGIGIV